MATPPLISEVPLRPDFRLGGIFGDNTDTHHQKSGDAVFRHRGKDAARIGAAIGKSRGFEPRVYLLDLEELARIIADIHFPRANPSRGCVWGS